MHFASPVKGRELECCKCSPRHLDDELPALCFAFCSGWRLVQSRAAHWPPAHHCGVWLNGPFPMLRAVGLSHTQFWWQHSGQPPGNVSGTTPQPTLDSLSLQAPPYPHQEPGSLSLQACLPRLMSNLPPSPMNPTPEIASSRASPLSPAAACLHPGLHRFLPRPLEPPSLPSLRHWHIFPKM